VGTQGVSQSRKNPIFRHFSSFFHVNEYCRKIFNVNDKDKKIFKKHFNYLHGEGFPISSRSKYEGKWGKMGFSTKAQKICIQANMSDKQKLTCDDNEKRVKNDQKTGVQKGSKMAKMGGPKKG
jgi:hypothetical protein